jgi:hypothetical protein
MTEQEKSEQDVKEKKQSIEDIKTQIVKLTAEFRKNQYELNQQIYNQGKDEYADIDLEKLLTTGRAYHKGSINGVPFIMKTMTKSESLFVDKESKKYLNESNDYYIGGVQVDSLAFILVEYNGKKSLLDPLVEDSFKEARKSVCELSDVVIDAIWNSYTKMTRFIKAALELNLKN